MIIFARIAIETTDYQIVTHPYKSINDLLMIIKEDLKLKKLSKLRKLK